MHVVPVYMPDGGFLCFSFFLKKFTWPLLWPTARTNGAVCIHNENGLKENIILIINFSIWRKKLTKHAPPSTVCREKRDDNATCWCVQRRKNGSADSGDEYSRQRNCARHLCTRETTDKTRGIIPPDDHDNWRPLLLLCSQGKSAAAAAAATVATIASVLLIGMRTATVIVDARETLVDVARWPRSQLRVACDRVSATCT